MISKCKAMVTRRDFDEVSINLAEFGRDGKYKRLNMTVDNFSEVPRVFYEVYYRGFRVGNPMTDLAEATRVYNGADVVPRD